MLGRWRGGACGFDLASEPPLRAHLFALGDERARAAFAAASHCQRRLVAGAAVARSVRAPMRRGLRGSAPEFLPLPVQYADYTLWQHEVLGREDDAQSAIARQLAFWTSSSQRSSRSDRSAERPAATCGGQPSRRQRATAHWRRTAPRSVGAGPREWGKPVHGAAGRPCERC